MTLWKNIMRYVECPDIYMPNLSKLANNKEVSVFMGGGISSCPDWQSELRMLLFAAKNLTLINPRRSNFPMGDPTASEFQINWEFQHIEKADAISFWFPKETLCPITLFEYGKILGQNQMKKSKRVFVGVHPEYQRKLDIEIQTKLVDPNIVVVYTIQDLAKQITELDK